MNTKFIFTILICAPSIFSYGQGIADKDKCEKLKQQQIHFSLTDIQYVQQQTFRLLDCGFDSVDCKIAVPIVGTLIINNSSRKGDTTVEYSNLIAVLNQLKKSPMYAQIRRETIYGNQIVKKIPSFLSIHQYFDYEEGRQCQAAIKKPLLIYFTAKFSVTSRKMEEDILSDTSVMRLLNNFILVTLYVDDNKVGKRNAEFQESKYKGYSQPEFIKQQVDGKWTALSGYVSKDEFTKFLER